MNAMTLPSAGQYSEAIQNIRLCFSLPILREGTLALDRLGMPLVMAGNFAVVFKLRLLDRTHAVKCFCRFLGDRESRFIAIHKQLSIAKPSRLTGFEYLSQAILVGGKRYPILLMEWIEGPTLNAYIDEVLTTNNFYQALQSLAEDWCRVVKELENCQIAHGDLQHGNIIVSQDGIRLVDLDGAFVPGLTGLKSAEAGHIHFQHPMRTTDRFDAGLDRFSSLVIYLSLLAIAETPSLWKRFHDENLIFKKDDFANPSGSALFQTLTAKGGNVAQLAEILKKACLDVPSKSPRLSGLVAVPERSKLPNWMHSSPVIVVETKTREATDRGGRYVPRIDWEPDNEQARFWQPSATFPPPSPSPINFPPQYPLPNSGQPPRAPHGNSSSTTTPPAPRSSSPQSSHNDKFESVVPIILGILVFLLIIQARQFFSTSSKVDEIVDRGYELHVLRDATHLELTGAIVFGVADDVRRSLDAHPTVRILDLNSNGGSVTEGRKLRDLIESRGLATYTSTRCYSACTLAYAAGRKRHIGAKAVLGFHVPVEKNSVLDSDYDKQDWVERGLRPDFIEKAFSIQNTEPWTPTHKELVDAGFVTDYPSRDKDALPDTLSGRSGG